MRCRTAVLAAFAMLGGGAGSAHAQTPLPIPEVWDTAYVVLLEANPEYRPASADERQATFQAHFQYQLQLIVDGRTIRGGPLAPEPGAALVGITVLRAASLDEARSIAAADPAVRDGLMRATVRTWITPRAVSSADADVD